MATPKSVGLSRAARLLFAATALAPVILVWAAASYEENRLHSFVAIAVSIGLVALCVGLVTLASRELALEHLPVRKVTRLDKDVLGFLVAYALPLVLSDDPTKLAALVVFMVLAGLVLAQLQILHVNPLLGALGFHFYEIELPDSDTALVVSRSRTLPTNGAEAQRLGPSLWLIVKQN